MGLQPAGDGQGIFILLANTQVQGLHSADQQVGSHRIEGGAGDLTIMVNLFYQRCVAANYATECIGVATQELGRAVNHQISA